MSTNLTINLTSRRASVLTVAGLLFLASCGRETLAPAAPADSVSALGSGLAYSSEKNESKKDDDKKGDDKKGDDKKGDDKKHDDKKHDDDHGNNDDRDPGLVVATAPGGAVAGLAFTVQPVLELRNHGGNLVMGNKSVTVSIVGSSVVLGGTTRVPLVKGVARFTNLSIPTAGSYTLLFTGDDFASVSVPITVAPRTVGLTVGVTGTGSVTSDVGGIDCPGACNASYDANTIVTLSAHPSPSVSTFGGWGGACSGNAACVVTMDAAKTVTATFTPISSGPTVLTLAFAGTGGASGSVMADSNGDLCTWSGTGAGAGICTWTLSNPNLYFTLIATPDAGSSFNGWTGATCANDPTGMNPQCDVVPGSGAMTITANFKKP